MTKIEQLRKQCQQTQGLVALPSEELRELLDLVEMQHEALQELSVKQARWTDTQINALDFFDIWSKS